MSCPRCEYYGDCACEDYCSKWECPYRRTCDLCVLDPSCPEGLARLELWTCQECEAQTVADGGGPVKCPMCGHGR